MEHIIPLRQEPYSRLANMANEEAAMAVVQQFLTHRHYIDLTYIQSVIWVVKSCMTVFSQHAYYTIAI